MVKTEVIWLIFRKSNEFLHRTLVVMRYTASFGGSLRGRLASGETVIVTVRQVCMGRHR
jgi:hypothetical protein